MTYALSLAATVTKPILNQTVIFSSQPNQEVLMPEQSSVSSQTVSLLVGESLTIVML